MKVFILLLISASCFAQSTTYNFTDSKLFKAALSRISPQSALWDNTSQWAMRWDELANRNIALALLSEKLSLANESPLFMIEILSYLKRYECMVVTSRNIFTIEENYTPQSSTPNLTLKVFPMKTATYSLINDNIAKLYQYNGNLSLKVMDASMILCTIWQNGQIKNVFPVSSLPSSAKMADYVETQGEVGSYYQDVRNVANILFEINATLESNQKEIKVN